MEASSAAWWRRASSRKSEIMALAAWFGMRDPCGINSRGKALSWSAEHELLGKRPELFYKLGGFFPRGLKAAVDY